MQRCKALNTDHCSTLIHLFSSILRLYGKYQGIRIYWLKNLQVEVWKLDVPLNKNPFRIDSYFQDKPNFSRHCISKIYFTTTTLYLVDIMSCLSKKCRIRRTFNMTGRKQTAENVLCSPGY